MRKPFFWPRTSNSRRTKSHGAPTYVSIIEPGTTAYRFLVAKVGDGNATICGWQSVATSDRNTMDKEWLPTVCSDACTAAEAMAEDTLQEKVVPADLTVGLAASRVVGRAWSVGLQRPHPERAIDEHELTALLSRVLRLSINRLQSKAPRIPGTPDAAWTLLDATPVELTIDGRRVTDPVGFRGRELGATLFAALARKSEVAHWGMIAQELGFSSLTLTATPLALATSLPEAEGVLVDVGGLTTELTRWQVGRPLAVDSWPFGGNELTQTLSRAWGLASSKAERLKLAYSDGKLASEAQEHIQKAIFPVLSDWYDQAETAMGHLNQDGPLPANVYLAGAGSKLPEIFDAVRALAWSDHLRFARYPQLTRLRPTDVQSVVNRTSKGRSPGDISALALASWVAQHRQSRDRASRIVTDLCLG